MAAMRWGLVLLIGAIAFVFFGSVICPPLDEREAEASGEEAQYPLQEDPATYKPLPGDLQIEDRFPITRADEESLEAAPAGDRSLQFRILDEVGRPVRGVSVTVAVQADGWRPWVQSLQSDAEGKAHAEKVPNVMEHFHAIASHPDYFDAEVGPMPMPADAAGTFLVAMVPAGRVRGLVQDRDRKAVVHGWLTLTPIDGGETIRFQAKAGGLFEGIKLLPGSYRLSWSDRTAQEGSPPMTFTFSLGPRQQRIFEVTIDRGETSGSRPEVGIVEVPE